MIAWVLICLFKVKKYFVSKKIIYLQNIVQVHLKQIRLYKCSFDAQVKSKDFLNMTGGKILALFCTVTFAS